MNAFHQQLYIESIKLLYQDSNGRSSLGQAELAAAAHAMAETLYINYITRKSDIEEDKCS
jgi:hypothetical protein